MLEGEIYNIAVIIIIITPRYRNRDGFQRGMKKSIMYSEFQNVVWQYMLDKTLL